MLETFNICDVTNKFFEAATKENLEACQVKPKY